MKLSSRDAPVADAAERAPARTPPESAPTVQPATAGNAALHRLASGRAPGHPAGLGAFAAGGNRALAQLGRALQPKLTVSRPGDPMERQADAVAERIVAGEPAGAGPAAPATRLVLPAAAAADPPDGPQTPPGLDRLLASPGAGAPIPPSTRAPIEAHLGVRMGGVQVHSGPAAQLAAGQLGARAFTSGPHIYLGAGESSTDLGLIAHEATHVVQQGAGVHPMVHRDATDFLMGPIRDLVSSVPGYDMLTVVAGYDPIANRNVDRSPENLTRGVLGLVPFGNVVAAKLIELGVVQGAARMLDDGLRARNLTLQRIQGEIDQAWKEIDLTDPDGALTIVQRHVAGLYTDALAFVKGVIDSIVQLIRDAAVGLAEKYLVGTPTWELVKKVLHTDPLRGTPVVATTVEILTDFLKLIGKEDALKQMQERGTLQKTADWLDARIGQFLGLLGELTALFEAGWHAIQPENLAQLPDNLSKLAGQAKGLIGRIGAFAGEVLTEVVRLIKDALLEWLSREAAGLRGFRLMTVLLGQDPFTGKAVPRTAENLIGGFIALLPGGEATYKKLAEAGVIADAAAQIEGAITRLGITPDLIIGTFRGIWDSLTLADLVNPVGAFVRILEKFGEPLGRIVEFAGEVVKVVVTLILKLMNFPSDLLGSIINNAMAAIEDIKKDPVAFLLNMLQALKHGFLGFIENALSYLLTGLADWLFRGLGKMGIQKPPDLSFGSILTLVLQVLDITAEKLWKKLGDQIGVETVTKIRKGLAVAEGAFDFIKDVQEGGVAAIWKHVEGQLGNLWDTLLGMVKDWIVGEIIEKATAKLISMLDPTGIMAVVNSSIAFFKAVQSVIEYVREILTIINDYVTTLAAVAAGNIQAGAQKVEKGLASAVPVAIGFLANQVGLGNVPEKLVELIGQLRVLVDKALDWLFEKAIALGKSALQALGLGGPEAKPDDPAAGLPPLEADEPIVMEDDPHRLYLAVVGGEHVLMLASANPGPALAKIEIALDDEGVKADGKVSNELREARRDIKALMAELHKWDHEQPNQRNASATERDLKAKIVEVKLRLNQIGQTFNILELKGNEFVDKDGVVLSNVNIRTTFYGGSEYNRHKGSVLSQAHDEKKAIEDELRQRFPMTYDKYEAGFLCPGVERHNISPHLAYDTESSLDHKETVVAHWEREGRSTDQDTRKKWYVLRQNLTAMCGRCNGIKNSEGENYNPQTTAGFAPPAKVKLKK